MKQEPPLCLLASLLLVVVGGCGRPSSSNAWQMPTVVSPTPARPPRAPTNPLPLPRGDLPDAKGGLYQDGWFSEELDARATAQRKELGLLIDFHADWCLPCVAMQRQTFRDPTLVRAMQGRVVPLRINVTEETKSNRLALKRHAVYSLPCVLLLDKQGRTRKRFDRFTSAEELLAHLRTLPVTVDDKPTPAVDTAPRSKAKELPLRRDDSNGTSVP